MKSQYELNGGTYTEIDGINYPNIAAPEPDGDLFRAPSSNTIPIITNAAMMTQKAAFFLSNFIVQISIGTITPLQTLYSFFPRNMLESKHMTGGGNVASESTG